ncbi:rubrerythrin [Pyrococcus furiosus DSM 3638]|uniref:Rubrerythrin n=3 Tax=Pyrococcus furiosus TaxID=2261 RepID=A0A5C0XNS4_PYRFU|nr:DUF835 domain-containing protein [Pyrococcus furiosus]AAL80262.1 hypothetical protein PF0138 [Pyrococcus furiosus DSM 3638]AFN04438.1 hypothetical protein PFC_07510 [Pyrococcus furiosus COM1]QEK77868.1 rubrerythrin [Pyrococcus furiosus DSM 3638]
MENDLKKLTKEIVGRLKNKSVKELLSYAIFNEEEEAKFYADLAEKVSRPSVKALFRRMSEESKVHELLLRKLFSKYFPGEEPVKVDVPPVEVVPFISKFESIEDYLEGLRYCMESELFAKRTYVLLSQVAENEGVRMVANELASIEQNHYEEIKAVYELVKTFRDREMLPESLKSGAYLITNESVGKYLILDLIDENKKLKLFVRENPEIFRRLIGENPNVEITWIAKVNAPNTISPTETHVLKKDIESFFEKVTKEGKKGVVFIQNVAYLVANLGFKETVDLLLHAKDLAVYYGGYLIITANPEVFEKTEWALLKLEFEVLF